MQENPCYILSNAFKANFERIKPFRNNPSDWSFGQNAETKIILVWPSAVEPIETLNSAVDGQFSRKEHLLDALVTVPYKRPATILHSR